MNLVEKKTRKNTQRETAIKQSKYKVIKCITKKTRPTYTYVQSGTGGERAEKAPTHCGSK